MVGMRVEYDVERERFRESGLVSQQTSSTRSRLHSLDNGLHNNSIFSYSPRRSLSLLRTTTSLFGTSTARGLWQLSFLVFTTETIQLHDLSRGRGVETSSGSARWFDAGLRIVHGYVGTAASFHDGSSMLVGVVRSEIVQKSMSEIGMRREQREGQLPLFERLARRGMVSWWKERLEIDSRAREDFGLQFRVSKL